MVFLVVSNAPTFTSADNSLCAYAPYVNEMELWFRSVDQVTIISPSEYPEKVFTKPFSFENIRYKNVPFFRFKGWNGSMKAIIRLPIIVKRLCQEFSKADHIHLRCPGNIGLIACVLQIFYPSKQKTAKYAGNWDPKAAQPWSYKLQRWILNNTTLTKNMQVLVYGEWLGQSRNIRSFFTASFSEKAILKVREKRFCEPYLFVFVGNLVPGKGLKTALNVIRRLQDTEVNCRLEIYGDGPERSSAEAYVEESALKDVIFKGNRTLEDLETAYQRAHFLILPSKSEGWPKAVAEAMFFGCIPVVTPVSCVPWMLGLEERGRRRVERGIFLEDGGQRTAGKDLEENVARIFEVLRDEERMMRMSEAAKEWSWKYTTEKFELEISQILHSGKKLDL